MISVERVLEINQEILVAVNQIFPQLTSFSPIPDENALNEIINSEASSLWIARNSDREIIGMLSLAIYRTTTGVHAWIEDVVVDQSARRQRVASHMSSVVIEYARQKSAKSISLTSRPEREAANQFYQNAGFELVNTNVYRMKLQ